MLFGSRARRMLYFTSSLVNSRPEWYITPLRRFSLMVLLSELRSQLSARRGTGLRLSSLNVSTSKIWPMVLFWVGAHWKPSVVMMSPTWPTRSVPPFLMFAAADPAADAGALPLAAADGLAEAAGAELAG